MADLWLFSLKRVLMEPEGRNSLEKIQQRKEWMITVKEQVYITGIKCIFIDEAGFNANLIRTQGWAHIGETPMLKKTSRANPISILGATYAKDLIKVLLRTGRIE
ncbi:hypothetical protein BDF20DRAFT_846863 [Mycotypha africana]|uniref:uncharacterized protein n=1 Tax=Mycotypha africana TaxID=64632 RepID=UPI002300E828|nr:uncharacterized protein BDF20DRAFT_846863 [Mycotypha africana]KAI8991863.1 hypothetical protein BDF20DRAFT_846863 [Mycotypha africana]